MENQGGGEDYISLLPDCLLIDIISRLPSTKEAIQTGTLSKRWQNLWPFVSNLIFEDSYPIKRLVSIVDKTLAQCHQSKLTSFLFCCCSYDTQFDSNVNNWLRYVASRNVQDLGLALGFGGSSEFVFHQSIFTNSCFTRLRFDGCVFNPTGAITWSQLTSLTVCQVEVTDALIQNILSGSPVLETFDLVDCYGYRRVHITSKSVKFFALSGYDAWEFPDDLDDVVEINAPFIVSLGVTGSLHFSKLLLLDVSSLVTAELDYKIGYDEITRRGKQELLKALIQRLCHVTELHIGSSCVSALSRLKAKGFIPPTNLKVYTDSDSHLLEVVHWSDRDSNDSGDSDGDPYEIGDSDGDSNESGDPDGDSEEQWLDYGVESEGEEVDDTLSSS